MLCPECGHSVDAHHAEGCFDAEIPDVGAIQPCSCRLTGGEAFAAAYGNGEES